MGKISVGVDVGGTSVKLGIFTIEGELVKKWEIKTNKKEGYNYVLNEIAETVRKNISEEGYTLLDCVGVGMGVPGPVMPDGHVEVCVNLGWRDVYPSRILSEMLDGTPVLINNDANVAALGESWQGGAKDYTDVVMFTLGTGVGGGVIIDRKIISGRHGMGGEIGHIHVKEGFDVSCNCGAYGCLEQIASATGIVNSAKKVLFSCNKESSMRVFGDEISAKDVLDCAKAGDELATEVMEEVCKYLGIAMSYITMIVDPDVIVVGGGVSKAGEYLIEKINKYYHIYTPLSKNKAKIVLATLGNDAGIYGAAKLLIS